MSGDGCVHLLSLKCTFMILVRYYESALSRLELTTPAFVVLLFYNGNSSIGV
jgi:hypothetical protein